MWNVLMFVQILLTSTIRNVWRTLRRMCILILGLKGIKKTFNTSVLQVLFHHIHNFFLISKGNDNKKNVSNHRIYVDTYPIHFAILVFVTEFIEMIPFTFHPVRLLLVFFFFTLWIQVTWIRPQKSLSVTPYLPHARKWHLEPSPGGVLCEVLSGGVLLRLYDTEMLEPYHVHPHYATLF